MMHNSSNYRKGYNENNSGVSFQNNTTRRLSFQKPNNTIHYQQTLREQSRSVSRDRSRSANKSGNNISTARKSSNLRRDDPQIKARLDNLVKSASMYKTKACGVMRTSFASNNNQNNNYPSKYHQQQHSSVLMNQSTHSVSSAYRNSSINNTTCNSHLTSSYMSNNIINNDSRVIIEQPMHFQRGRSSNNNSTAFNNRKNSNNNQYYNYSNQSSQLHTHRQSYNSKDRNINYNNRSNSNQRQQTSTSKSISKRRMSNAPSSSISNNNNRSNEILSNVLRNNRNTTATARSINTSQRGGNNYNSKSRYNQNSMFMNQPSFDTLGHSKAFSLSSFNNDNNQIYENQSQDTLDNQTQNHFNKEGIYNSVYQQQQNLGKQQQQQNSFISTNTFKSSRSQGGQSVMSAGGQSIKPFCDDAEFIEFLKNISIFVTQEETPRDMQDDIDFISNQTGRSKLFQNLQYLREKFKDYKMKKSTINGGSFMMMSYNDDVQSVDINNQTLSQHQNQQQCDFEYTTFDKQNKHDTFHLQQSVTISPKPLQKQNQHQLQQQQHKPKIMSTQNQYKPQKSPNNNNKNSNTTVDQMYKQQLEINQVANINNKCDSKKAEQLKQLPEKQRKQIEFIDEIYEKIVLNKSSQKSSQQKEQNVQLSFSNNKNTKIFELNNETPRSNLITEDKENQYDSENYKPMNIILKTQDSQLETSSFFTQSRSNIQNIDSTRYHFDQTNNNMLTPKTPLQQNLFNYDLSANSQRSFNTNMHLPFNSYQQQQQQQQQQPSAQIEETLKALTETAQQLKQACLGINQVASHLMIQNPYQQQQQQQQQNTSHNLNSSSHSLQSSFNDRLLETNKIIHSFDYNNQKLQLSSTNKVLQDYYNQEDTISTPREYSNNYIPILQKDQQQQQLFSNHHQVQQQLPYQHQLNVVDASLSYSNISNSLVERQGFNDNYANQQQYNNYSNSQQHQQNKQPAATTTTVAQKQWDNSSKIENKKFSKNDKENIVSPVRQSRGISQNKNRQNQQPINNNFIY